MYRPIQTVAPAITPITLAEAKAHLRITTTTDDALLTGFIAAATAQLDGWTGELGRCLCEQTWRQDYDVLRYELRLPLFPVISVSSVKYDDTSAVEQTIDPSKYQLLNDGEGAFVRLNWTFVLPNTYYLRLPAVRIEYVAGYADAAGVSTVPEAIKAAMKLMVGNMYWQGEQSPFLSLRRIEGVGERRYVRSQDSMAAIEKAVDTLLAPYRRTRV